MSDKRLAELEEAIGKNNADREALLEKASILSLDKNYEGLLVACRQILKYYPDDFDAYDQMASSYSWSKRYKEAIDIYQKCLELKPRDLDTVELLAQAYSDDGQYEAALQEYDLALEIDPENASAYFWKGDTYQKMKQYESALEYFIKAEKHAPDENGYFAIVEQGSILAKLGRMDEAMSAFDRATKLRPGTNTAWVTQIGVLTNQQRHKEALELSYEALKHCPEDGALLEIQKELQSSLKKILQ